MRSSQYIFLTFNSHDPRLWSFFIKTTHVPWILTMWCHHMYNWMLTLAESLDYWWKAHVSGLRINIVYLSFFAIKFLNLLCQNGTVLNGAMSFVVLKSRTFFKTHYKNGCLRKKLYMVLQTNLAHCRWKMRSRQQHFHLFSPVSMKCRTIQTQGFETRWKPSTVTQVGMWEGHDNLARATCGMISW